ncbi:hypothetical protein CBLAS_0812 [Campylobacter blaseri]|uniref:C4-dicarboxylate ABC transporter n=1 Tax=Campylobacter blaseri TaxID=2042961 RepID=A0A2P8R2K4_9BACT|nr:hypothetical protein [Campylobacter blaseri]PSM52698.1 hypothetical protein CQ405_02920 [Campylobacter blaseri]PSM54346.1 hypothetical protein CRN67_02920 [Campylobacter blaseri]QKF85999.1 hypothetical protein CBLAS_0812 [Campylobacter blaseri]
MIKKKNETSIVVINRSTEKVFSISDNYLKEYDVEKSDKNKEFYISYISYKDIESTTIEIPRSIPNEDLTDSITIKTYEDLSLEPSNDYKITYLETSETESEDRFYNIFVVNNTILNNELENIANHTQYIDYVAIAPFLMQSLYKKSILPVDGSVDCFVYMEEDDAFLVVYQNGEYFDSRPLRYSLKYICDKFCQSIGEKIDNKMFYEMVARQGITLENPNERDALIAIFDDMFLYLNDVISSIKKIHGLSVDNIYFGSDIGHIKGVEVFIEDRLKINFRNFDFSIALNQKDFKDFTQLDVLMFLTAQVYLAEKNDDYNYSSFLRPPPFVQRDSGKLILASTLSLILAMVYPAYQYGYGMVNKQITAKKAEEYAVKLIEKTRIENELNRLKQEIDKTKKLTKQENDILMERKQILSAIFDKKVNYPMKSKAIYDMTNMINTKGGKLVKINADDSNITFSVATETEKKMTELLRNISDKGEKYTVDTKSIALDEDNNTIAYQSDITIEVKK